MVHDRQQLSDGTPQQASSYAGESTAQHTDKWAQGALRRNHKSYRQFLAASHDDHGGVGA